MSRLSTLTECSRWQKGHIYRIYCSKDTQGHIGNNNIGQYFFTIWGERKDKKVALFVVELALKSLFSTEMKMKMEGNRYDDDEGLYH